MAGSLKLQIIKILNKDIVKDDDADMSLIRSILRTKYKYGRNVLQKIGNNPLTLYDTLSRDGMIKENDHSKLIDVLKEADLSETADEIEKVIEEHQTKHIQAKNGDRDRPQNLTIHKRTAEDGGDLQVKRARLVPSVSSSSQGSFVSPDYVPSSYGFPQSAQGFYLSDADRYYSLEENKRGIVAIINNFTIDNSSLFRKGTNEDEEQIRKFFTEGDFNGKYTVRPQAKNLSKNAFERELTVLADLLNRESESIHSFFLFIMSHGEQGGVKAYYPEGEEPADGSVIPIDHITNKFKSCIRGRPKVIMIQACQGEADNTCIEVEPDAIPSGVQYPDELGDDPNVEEVEGDNISAPIPEAADMLVALATVKGYRSYRVKKSGPGSWFIKDFIEQLTIAHKPQYFSTHLVDILTEVQYQVSKRKGKTAIADSTMVRKKVEVRQMPCYQSTLRKKFYLLPPRLPYTSSP